MSSAISSMTLGRRPGGASRSRGASTDRRGCRDRAARCPGGGTASRTICTRRSAFVNVPVFSRKLEPGSITWANFAVTFSKMSWTTRRSSDRSASSTWCTFGSVCAMSSPKTYIAFSFFAIARSNISGIIEAALRLDRLAAPLRLELLARRRRPPSCGTS